MPCVRWRKRKGFRSGRTWTDRCPQQSTGPNRSYRAARAGEECMAFLQLVGNHAGLHRSCIKDACLLFASATIGKGAIERARGVGLGTRSRLQAGNGQGTGQLQHTSTTCNSVSNVIRLACPEARRAGPAGSIGPDEAGILPLQDPRCRRSGKSLEALPVPSALPCRSRHKANAWGRFEAQREQRTGIGCLDRLWAWPSRTRGRLSHPLPARLGASLAMGPQDDGPAHLLDGAGLRPPLASSARPDGRSPARPAPESSASDSSQWPSGMRCHRSRRRS